MRSADAGLILTDGNRERRHKETDSQRDREATNLQLIGLRFSRSASLSLSPLILSFPDLIPHVPVFAFFVLFLF